MTYFVYVEEMQQKQTELKKAETNVQKEASVTKSSASPGDHLRKYVPQVMLDNGPRVVAGLKIAGCCGMVLSKNWAFRTAGSMFIAGNAIMAVFGHKKSDEERKKLQADEDAKGGKEQNSFIRHMQKVVQPKKYPIESGMTVFTAGSVFWLVSGLTGNMKSKWQMAGGSLSLLSDANGAFNKENTDDAKELASKQGLDRTITYLKHRPLFTSSLLNIGADSTTFAGGAYAFFKQKAEPHAMIAGGLMLIANVFQALFVNKNDYNIEKTGRAKEATINAFPTELKKEITAASPTVKISDPAHQATIANTTVQQMAL